MNPDRSALTLCVDVLGSLVLRVRGQEVAVPGARRRALLSVLALAGGRAVGTERLIEALWPDGPPENAAQALYNHVSRLRGHLGAESERLQRYGGGYLLEVEPDEVDALAARRLADVVAARGTTSAAVAAARSALELWRGKALEEFRSWPALEPTAVALDELRLRLTDDLLDARLALEEPGVSADAVAAATSAPLRERTVLLLVRALAQEGRTAEAMAAAQDYRARLAEETGLDPGPALAELEQRVAGGGLGIAAGSPDDRPLGVVARPDGPLVGRQLEREEVRRLLGDNAAITVTGPGGVGKTRLALEVAADVSADLEDGGTEEVVVVDLAAVDRPDRVCQAVASTLRLRTSGEVTAVDVAAVLAQRRLLLVLDNCEHVPDACRDLVTTLRRTAPGVRVLATSRTVLHVPGEHVVRLQPLPVPREPADLDTLTRQPAVRAFLEHARRRRPAYELNAEDADDITDVLRRLDGLPLGIELAARQVALMPLADVRERLDRALDLAIAPGAVDDDRQRTLRATIDSSYRLLPDHERWLLRAMAPFPGGVDLATVEALARGRVGEGDPLDVLHRLVDASLVVADPGAGRYRLLFTVRAFLLDELRAEGELEDAERRFLDRCLDIAEEVGLGVVGPDETRADRRLRAELGNLRAARDTARLHGRDDVRVGITVHLSEAATWRDIRELWAWALELAVDPALDDHPDRAAVLGCAAEGARLLGDLDGASALAHESLAVAGSEADPAQVHRAYVALGSVAHFRGDFVAAKELWIRSGEGRPVTSGAWLASAALAAAYGGDRDEARRLLDRGHVAVAASGCGSHAAFASYVEGELRATERVEESVPYYEEAIEQARRCGVAFVAGVASVALASARARTGDTAGAAEEFGELLDTWRRTGHTTQLWTTARNAAALLASVGRWRVAGLLLICAEAQPGAAAVSARIARHSGRVFVPLADVVPDDELEDLRAEATRRGADQVLDVAREELRTLAADGQAVARPMET
ncbi:MAG: BTAD domain-containing putative transcriptional regulator [Nocardioides sp.]